eukprot:tig00000852_g5037.t1
MTHTQAIFSLISDPRGLDAVKRAIEAAALERPKNLSRVFREKLAAALISEGLVAQPEEAGPASALHEDPLDADASAAALSTPIQPSEPQRNLPAPAPIQPASGLLFRFPRATDDGEAARAAQLAYEILDKNLRNLRGEDSKAGWKLGRISSAPAALATGLPRGGQQEAKLSGGLRVLLQHGVTFEKYSAHAHGPWEDDAAWASPAPSPPPPAAISPPPPPPAAPRVPAAAAPRAEPNWPGDTSQAGASGGDHAGAPPAEADAGEGAHGRAPSGAAPRASAFATTSGKPRAPGPSQRPGPPVGFGSRAFGRRHGRRPSRERSGRRPANSPTFSPAPAPPAPRQAGAAPPPPPPPTPAAPASLPGAAAPPALADAGPSTTVLPSLPSTGGVPAPFSDDASPGGPGGPLGESAGARPAPLGHAPSSAMPERWPPHALSAGPRSPSLVRQGGAQGANPPARPGSMAEAGRLAAAPSSTAAPADGQHRLGGTSRSVEGGARAGGAHGERPEGRSAPEQPARPALEGAATTQEAAGQPPPSEAARGQTPPSAASSSSPLPAIPDPVQWRRAHALFAGRAAIENVSFAWVASELAPYLSTAPADTAPPAPASAASAAASREAQPAAGSVEAAGRPVPAGEPGLGSAGAPILIDD